MKTICVMMSLVVAASGMAMMADNVEPDTLTVIDSPKSVVISKKGGQTVVSVTGTADNPDFRYNLVSQTSGVADTVVARVEDEEWGLNMPFLKDGKPSRAFTTWFNDVYVNMVFPSSAPAGMKTSWELGVGEFVRFSYEPSSRARTCFSIGLGMGYRRLAFGKGERLELNDGKLTLFPAEEGVTVKSSSIDEWDVRIPVTVTQPLYKDLKLAVGGVAVFNVNSRAYTTIERDGSKFSESYKGLHQRLLQCELFATLGFDDAVGLTVRYRPMNSFTDGYGPEYKSVALGLSFNF